MISSNALSQEMLIDEISGLICEGYTISQIANRLKLPVEKIKELTSSETFKRAISKIDPEVGVNLGLISPDASDQLKAASDFVSARILKYVKKLDELVGRSESDQVVLNTIKELLSFTAFRQEASKVETFIVDPTDINRFIEALKDINGDHRAN